MPSDPRSPHTLAPRRWLSALLSAYAPLFAIPSTRLLVAFSLLGRLSIGVLDIPLVLLVQSTTNSYAIAGVTIAMDAAGIAASASLRGRALDRYGSRRVVPILGVLRAASICALWPVAETGQAGAILPLAALAGIFVPPMPAAMRLQWKTLLGPGDRRIAQAHAFETVAQVSLYVLGPALAAVGIATVGSGPTLVVTGALLVAGAIPFGARAVDDRSPPSSTDRPRERPIRVPGVQTLLLATLIADSALGFIDVTVTAFARQHQEQSAAGLALAVFALAGVIAGTAYGARHWRAPPRRRLLYLTAAAAILYVPLIVAPSLAWLAGLLILAGAPSAAQWTTSYVTLDQVAPASAAGEALSWMSAANAAGVGAGDAAAGLIIDAGSTHVAFAVAAGLLAVAAVLLRIRQTTLVDRRPEVTSTA